MVQGIFWLIVMGMVLSVPVFFMKQAIQSARMFFEWISSLTRQDFRAYCGPEIGVDDIVFKKDGSVSTFFRFRGHISIVGDREFFDALGAVKTRFASLQNDHDIQFVYRQDDGGSARAVTNAILPSMASAKRIGMKIERIFEDHIATLTRRVITEDCCMVVTTYPVVSSKETIKADAAERFAAVKKMDLPLFTGGQNPAKMVDDMIVRHNSFLETIEAAFAASRIRADRLSARDGLALVKMELDSTIQEGWRPRLPGDRIAQDLASQVNGRGVDEESFSGDLLYPPLWKQLAPGDAFQISGREEKVLLVGDGESRFYGSVAMELPPIDVKRIELLSKSMRRAGVPFRISFRIFGNGMSARKLEKTLVGFFSMFPKSVNRRIKNAMDFLDEQGEANPICGVAILATTWGNTERECGERMQILAGQMRSWGQCDVSSMSGDPMSLFASGLPGFSTGVSSDVMLFPSSEIAYMLPLDMASSPWTEGGMLFVDIRRGKLMPYQPGSSLQPNWVSLIFAKSGSGKSVLMLSLEEAVCLAPGLSRLPLMTVIDVGESVSGLIYLLQSSLPENRKNEAGYFKIQMTPDYAVNVMDTQPGFRYPLPQERDFLVTFLSMLATPAGRDKPYDSMYEVMGLAIDEMYKNFSDKFNPKRYEAGVDAVVDRAISENRLDFLSKPTWWEVVDALFEKGLVVESALAQRYAVPLVSDITAVLNSPAITDIYAAVKVAETGESLVEIASRMISSGLREYRILSSPTKWDIANCRVVGLDLNDVRGNGDSGAARKQSALMYAFAQNLASRNYFLHPEMLKSIPSLCPEAYRDYHKKRIDDLGDDIKTIAYDEFHNTGGLEGIRKIVGQVIREGRKFGIQVMLASQLLEDFDAGMIENATSIYVLPMDNDQTIRQCKNVFGLSDSAVEALEKDIKSPGQFLAVWSTKMGKSVHALQNLLSPTKTWVYSTTSEAKKIRKKLSESMPYQDAILLLAKNFKSDSLFKDYVERRRRGMTDERDDTGVIESIARELMEGRLPKV